MRKLIVGNVDNEAMIGDTSRATLPLRQVSAIAARRLVWQLGEQDIAVLPSLVSEPMMAYVAETIGRKLLPSQVISPAMDLVTPVVLTSDVLLSETMLSALKAAGVGVGDWEVLPYFYTSSIGILCEELRIGQSTGTPNFMAQAGAELLNRKAVFRALCAGRVNCAEGFVCRTARELHLVLREMLSKHASVIVKQDVNAGGDGNIAVTLEDRDVYPGVHQVYALAGMADLTDAFSQAMWERQTDTAGNCQVVVEQFYRSSTVLYSEYEIAAAGSRRISFGDLRMDASGDKRGNGMVMWTGFQIPCQPHGYALNEFHRQCDVLAEIARSLGYIGCVNFDAIVTDEGALVFTEINGRLGGCSHLDGVLRNLAGEDYLHTHTVLTRNRVPVNDLGAALAAANAMTHRRDGAGVVVLTEDLGGTGTIEYMTYARDENEAFSMERGFLDALALSPIEESVCE